MPAKPRKPAIRRTTTVGIHLYPDDVLRFARLVESVPEAKGNHSLAFRIFLERWDASQAANRRKGKL